MFEYSSHCLFDLTLWAAAALLKDTEGDLSAAPCDMSKILTTKTRRGSVSILALFLVCSKALVPFPISFI